MTSSEALARIERSGLIAIIRGDFSLDRLLAIGNTLVSAGISVLEITLNTTNALPAVEQLRRDLGEEATVGVGTVRTAEQLRDALYAGAQFTVAPNFDPDTVALARARDHLHLPGVFTPTEAETAFRAGCRLLKLFPADVVGPSYVKALRAPLDDVSFVPTGGISAQNIGLYRSAGAFACGIGSALVTDADQPRSDLEARSQRLRQAWQEAS